jgi:hypothetical protein
VLLQELQTLDADERLSRLLSLAPFVSETIILALIGRASISADHLEQLLAANPDLIYSTRVRLALPEAIAEESVNEWLSATTTRSEQAQSLAATFAQLQLIGQLLISHELLQENPNSTIIQSYLFDQHSRMSRYALVDYHLQNGELTKAVQATNEIEVLTAEEESVLADYQDFVRLIVDAANEDRKLFALTDEEVGQLVNWAENSHDKAQRQARAILNFFYDYDYLPDGRDDIENRSIVSDEVAEEPQLSRWQAVQVYPNPAQGAVTFSYDLSNFQEKEGILQIHGMDGQILHRFNLRGETGSFEWNTNDMQAGVYFYKLYLKESATSIHKLLIVR